MASMPIVLSTVDNVYSRLRRKLLTAREELHCVADDHARNERDRKEDVARREAMGLTRALQLLDELYREIEDEVS